MNDLMMTTVSGILGATLTFYVSEHYKLGPIRSSALLSVSVGLFFYCFPHLFNSYLTKNIPLVFMGTSFIGMVSSKSYGSYFRLAVAGTLFSTIYCNKSLFFEGFGGALGALAFISLLTVISISDLLSRKAKMKRVYVRARRSVFKYRN
ncbi:hypothetical protein Q73A0000_04935 [Kaistella flava (ex Peng et al. 2021)]|uniref:Uncharacterized protein n=1 Tax=Kaistella flava (ex Peng et al. 2021) TaxID=2038776 RepID=A0A7M2Y689_9FLAO|nr:hypothetical protein [Kaistella flava (ex Peng et al. 2021)]QOW09758.1 hypothetical protein Q73A0000_04935 [Kaistella flava (ex Peng et al. 2021)]